ASAALAQRAMVDLSPEVREEAVKALMKRPAEDVRDLLVAGLRYPWAPVADHAAEALVALGDKEAVPLLIQMLKEPDPRAPFFVSEGEARTPVVHEVVRINHLKNCVLCHSPSFAQTDLVRGAIPVP